MNLPNRLTVSRLVMAALFLWAIMARAPYAVSIALVLFVAASLTDLLDGQIARRRNLITNFGILLDPLADKILICSAYIALVERGMLAPPPPIIEWGGIVIRARVEAWMAVIVVARELAITGLRLLAASKHLVLAAERYGKHKTISQMTAIIALLTVDACAEWPAWLGALFAGWAPYLALISLWLSVLLTAASGAIYLWRNRQLFLADC